MLQFVYDESGAPYALRYSADGGSSWRTFYYILNLQGDVVELVYADKTVCATYTYNAWGQIISAETTAPNITANLAELNPLRYRGYYYDTETGFYYLQSRYYDPAICRFLNADVFTSTGQDVLGFNMFAYCENNPANKSDPNGMFGFWTVCGGALAGVITSTISYMATSTISGQEITAGGVINAVLVGGITGYLGAIMGEVNGIKKAVCAIAVGVTAGINAARNTDGTMAEKIIGGVIAGGIAGVTAYIGSSLFGNSLNRGVTGIEKPWADAAQGMLNYTAGILLGPAAEAATYGAQQVVHGWLGQSSKPASGAAGTLPSQPRSRPHN